MAFTPLPATSAALAPSGFTQKSSPTYCAGDGPPPPPASCPTVHGGRAECVAPEVTPSAWSATSTYWTSYPTCNATPGNCASEAAAWTAWRNNITSSICQEPARSYVCTDLYGGYQLGQDIHSANLYSLTVGTGTAASCSVWTEPSVAGFQMKSAVCPTGYVPVSFNAGPCHTVKKASCPYGNPIQCAGGQKMPTETDIAGATVR